MYPPLLDSQMVANAVSGIVNHSSLTHKNPALQMWRSEVNAFLVQVSLSNGDVGDTSKEEVKRKIAERILRANRVAVVKADIGEDQGILNDPTPTSQEFSTLRHTIPLTADGLLYLSAALEHCAEGVGGEGQEPLSIHCRTLALSARHAALRLSPAYNIGVTPDKVAALRLYCSENPDVRASFANIPGGGTELFDGVQQFFSLLEQPEFSWTLGGHEPYEKNSITHTGARLGTHGTNGPLMVAMFDTLKHKLATLPFDAIRRDDGRHCSASERNQLMLWLMRSTNNFTRLVTDMATLYPGKKPYLQEVSSSRNPLALCELPVIIPCELLARGVRGDLRESDYFDQAYLMQDEHLAHSLSKGMPGCVVAYSQMSVTELERLRQAGRVIKTEVGLKVEDTVRRVAREYGLTSGSMSPTQLTNVICKGLSGCSMYLPSNLEAVVLKQLSRECVPAYTMSSNISKAVLESINITTQKYANRSTTAEEKPVATSDNRFLMR